MMLILATGFGLGVLLTALAAQPRKLRTSYGSASWTAGTIGTITMTAAPFGADSPSQRAEAARAAIDKALS